MLLQPVDQNLTSELKGSRLVRSLLDAISSQLICNLFQLATYIEGTCLYALTSGQNVCSFCKNSYHENGIMFGFGEVALDENDQKESNLIQESNQRFQTFINNFDLEGFIRDHLPAEYIQEDEEFFCEQGIDFHCKNCIFEFSKQSLGYL